MLSSSCESEDFGQTHQHAYLETRVSSTDTHPFTRLARTPFHTVGPLDSIMTASLCEFRYGEQKIAQFRTHYFTKELAYVSTQQSGYFSIDTEMI